MKELDDRQKHIIEKIHMRTGVPKAEIYKAYMSQFHFIRKTIVDIDYFKEMSLDDINDLKASFNIKWLFKMRLVPEKLYNRLLNTKNKEDE